MDEASTIRSELETYLHERDMNEYFTSIIESCLMAQPENPSLHIIQHLCAKWPSQIPPMVAVAVESHRSAAGGGNKAKNADSVPKAVKHGSSIVESSSVLGSTPSSRVSANESLAATAEGHTEADEDLADEEDDDAPVDGMVLKYSAMAHEGGVAVFLGGPMKVSRSSVPTQVLDEDIVGGTVRTRAELAAAKLIAIAEVGFEAYSKFTCPYKVA